MMAKRHLSSTGADEDLPIPKRLRIRYSCSLLSELSDELLIRILHNLPIHTLLLCQRLSHRFYTLAGDSQLWKNLYYKRFVLPRALRIPGIKTGPSDDSLHFSSRRSKWLDDNTLVNRLDGKKTNWKGQYKLRHNWSIGACEVQEIHVADRPSVPSMLVKLAEGIVLTADKEDGIRAWDLKERTLIAEFRLDDGQIPTCLAVDEQQPGVDRLGIAVGFEDGGWAIWRLDTKSKTFTKSYEHSASSNGMLSAVAYANPYILTITDSQLLSLYTFAPVSDLEVPRSSPPLLDIRNGVEKPDGLLALLPIPKETIQTSIGIETQPRLLASLKSHTSWPPLSLSIRTTTSTIIASIAYSLPTYLSGYTVGLQELHLSLSTGNITFSRLASALPQGFSSLLTSPAASSTSQSSPSGTSSPSSTHASPISSNSGTFSRPTSLSYSHPYILATHPDNTLTLYLCTSTASSLSITSGIKLWGHTSSVSSAEITPRGKAVSVSTRGNELRVWELEGGATTMPTSRKRIARLSERSVRVRTGERLGEIDDSGDDCEKRKQVEEERYIDELEAKKRWVGFDDEMVIVLKESGRGSQALMIYDFT